MVVKEFSEVEVGDLCYSAEFPDLYQGVVLWKGESLRGMGSPFKKMFKHTIEDILGMFEEGGEDELYKWVILDIDEYGPEIFNYSCDPSGVIAFKE